MLQDSLFENQFLVFCQSIKSNPDFIKDYTIIYKLWVLCDLYFIANKNADWLREKIYEDIIDLVENELNDNRIKRLLETAFIFATLSSENLINEEEIEWIDQIKNLAYRIAISIYYYGIFSKETNSRDYFNNNTVIYWLFTRLWILSKARNENLKDIDPSWLNFQWRLETVIKEKTNSFPLQDGKILFFSDFQTEAIKALNENKSLSISAPTSAGKTFLIKNYILKKILFAHKESKTFNTIFIVPTKALINEIFYDFKDELHQNGIWEQVNVISFIKWEKFEEDFSLDWKKSNIFIFTQERLYYFFNTLSKPNELKVNLIVIDEAHKVWYGNRWLLLKYIINDIYTSLNTKPQIVFLSPLIKQTEEFKNIFDIRSLSLNKKFSRFNLVTTNIILCEARGKFTLFDNILNTEIELLKYSYSKWNSFQDRLISTYNLFNENSKSILYYQDPWLMIDICEKIWADLVEWETDFSIFLKDTIWATQLSEVIWKGIGFHNGKLPPYIRYQIEKDFKSKEWKIKQVVCNNTILEGVNLPAKSLFIVFTNKTLRLSANDFNNLIWRVWRLGEHFSGNIFIDTKNFNKDLIEKVDATVTTNPEDQVLDWDQTDTSESKLKKFTEFIKWVDYPILTLKDAERYEFEYLLSFLYIQRIKLSPLVFEQYLESKRNLKKIKLELIFAIDALIWLVNSLQISEKFAFHNILRRNMFIDIRKLFRLYTDYKKWIVKIPNLNILSSPWSHFDEFKATLYNLMCLVNEYILTWYYYHQYYVKHKNYIYWWRNDKEERNPILSFSIMCGRIYEDPSIKLIPRSSGKSIFSLYDIINNRIQFTYINAINAFLWVINTYNLLTWEKEIPDDIITYLELGAHSPLMLYLLKKWLSREIAIYLAEFLLNSDKNFRKYEWNNESYYFNYLLNNKEKIITHLTETNKLLILNEVKEYLY